MSQLLIKPYNQQLKIPYRWSKGTQYVRRGLLFKAVIDGYVGWGEAALPPHVNFQGWSFAAHCAALLDGLSIDDPNFLDELALREVSPRLRCGISSAIFSAKAAQCGQNLARFISKPKESPLTQLPVNDLITSEDPGECVKQAKAAVERGQNVIKLKCTDARKLDISRVKAIREA